MRVYGQDSPQIISKPALKIGATLSSTWVRAELSNPRHPPGCVIFTLTNFLASKLQTYPAYLHLIREG